MFELSFEVKLLLGLCVGISVTGIVVWTILAAMLPRASKDDRVLYWICITAFVVIVGLVWSLIGTVATAWCVGGFLAFVFLNYVVAEAGRLEDSKWRDSN